MFAKINNLIERVPPFRRLTILLIASAILSTHFAPLSSNDMSRMAAVQSLVESHTLVIDHTSFIETIDKVFINGHFYSDKPPMLSVIGAAIYLPLHAAKIDLHPGASLAYYLITLTTVKALWILGVIAFYSSLGFTGLNPEKRLLAGAALGFGTLLFSWSTTFNNHSVAASLLAIGFYFLLKARFSTGIKLNLCFGGLFLAFAGTIDYPTGIFYCLFFLYILRDSRLRSHLTFYVLPLLATVFPALALNFATHHSVMPVQITRSYFEYPGSPWIGSDELSGMRTNDIAFTSRYAFLAFLGPKGFLLYNPLLPFALWGLARTMRHRGVFYYEGIVVALGCSLLVLYYLLTTTNYGGWSYSVRWFVPMLPLLFFFVHPYLEPYNPRRNKAFLAVLCISVCIAIVGAMNPWSHASFSSVAFIANLEWFVAKIAPLVHAAR